MSLAIMFYKQPNRRRRLSDEATQAQGTEEVFGNLTRIDRTRSLGFPVVIMIAALVLLVSIFHSTMASAEVGEQQLLCHSTDAASDVTLDETSVKNIGTERAQVVCAIDMPPSVSKVSASIRLESSSDVLLSRCTFNARSAFGGQARGVPLQTGTDNTDENQNGWLKFTSLDTGMDDFRYISCDLAPGSAITGLRVTSREMTVARRPLVSRDNAKVQHVSQTTFITLQ